jgi:hypothetical protein
MTVLYVISFFGWPLGLAAVGGILSANAKFAAMPGVFVPLLATFAYPVIVIGGLIAAWVLHAKGRYEAAFWCAMLPLIDFVLGVLILLLMYRMFFGHF